MISSPTKSYTAKLDDDNFFENTSKVTTTVGSINSDESSDLCEIS